MQSRHTTAVGACGLVIGLCLLVVGDCSPAEERVQSPSTTSTSPSVRDLPSTEILSLAVADTDAADTLHLKFTLQNAGKVLVFDLQRAASGDCFGEFTQQGQTASVIGTNGHVYIRGSAEFWNEVIGNAPAEVMASQTRKWGRFPDNAAFQELCDITTLMEVMDPDEDRLDDLETRPRTVYDGREAVLLSTHDNEIQLFIDAGAPHYILAIKDYGDHLRITNHGEPADAVLPPPSQVVRFRSTTTLI